MADPPEIIPVVSSIQLCLFPVLDLYQLALLTPGISPASALSRNWYYSQLK
jgi:hypothetical protein